MHTMQLNLDIYYSCFLNKSIEKACCFQFTGVVHALLLYPCTRSSARKKFLLYYGVNAFVRFQSELERRLCLLRFLAHVQYRKCSEFRLLLLSNKWQHWDVH